jgi:eukaryotic-like serine/threonine-protein kinase
MTAAALPRSRLGAIAEEALELGPSHRAAYLEDACGTDVELLRQVEALLEAEREAGSFLEGSFLESPAAFGLADELFVSAAPAAFAGQHVGPYRIERPLGAGGVGEVFLASRADDQFEHPTPVARIPTSPVSWRLRSPRSPFTAVTAGATATCSSPTASSGR